MHLGGGPLGPTSLGLGKRAIHIVPEQAMPPDSGVNGSAAMLLRGDVNGSRHSTNMLGDGPAPICHGTGRLQDLRLVFTPQFCVLL